MRPDAWKKALSHALLGTVLSAPLAGGCAQVLGGERELSADAEARLCDDDDDCIQGSGCDDGVCRQKCLEDTECILPFTECFSDFCTDPPGTPCDSDEISTGFDCGSSTDCQEVNASNEEVDGYCAPSCPGSSTTCPPGFTCLGSECLRVDG